jgi:hypothetical protein
MTLVVACAVHDSLAIVVSNWNYGEANGYGIPYSATLPQRRSSVSDLSTRCAPSLFQRGTWYNLGKPHAIFGVSRCRLLAIILQPAITAFHFSFDQ